MTHSRETKISNAFFSVSKKVGAAIADYDMLKDGDKILLAISGGKDSVSLLKLFQYRQTFIPIHIDIMAVHIDMGIPGFPVDQLEQYFLREKVPYHVEKIDILQGKEWKDINCFWCSWNRKKCLFELAEKFGFNKIAVGHHMDDIIETTLLNMFYNGEISTMKPKQEFFQGKFHIIRPLAYVKESEIARLVSKEKILQIDEFACPQNDRSKRKMIKEWLQALSRQNPDIKQNIFKSLQRVREEYLLKARSSKSRPS
jgi:tRNA 2-thiocytidine biosynthesis protein TtcA